MFAYEILHSPQICQNLLAMMWIGRGSIPLYRLVQVLLTEVKKEALSVRQSHSPKLCFHQAVRTRSPGDSRTLKVHSEVEEASAPPGVSVVPDEVPKAPPP